MRFCTKIKRSTYAAAKMGVMKNDEDTLHPLSS